MYLHAEGVSDDAFIAYFIGIEGCGLSCRH